MNEGREKGAGTQGVLGGELGARPCPERGERRDQPAGRWELHREWLFADRGTGGWALRPGHGLGWRRRGWGGGAGARSAPRGLPSSLRDPAGRVGECPACAVCAGTAQEMRTRLLTWLEERDELNWEAQPGRLGHWCARVCAPQ